MEIIQWTVRLRVETDVVRRIGHCYRNIYLIVIRKDIYTLSQQLISDSPIVGYGVWRAYKITFTAFSGYSHNIVLDVLLQGGFFGLCLFVYVMLKVVKGIYVILRIDPSKTLILPIASLAFTQLLFSGTWLNSSLFWFFVTFILAYMSVHNNILKAKGNSLNPVWIICVIWFKALFLKY